MSDRYRVKPQKLRWRCDPAKLGFETTEELPPLTSAIGQKRAVEALEFGLCVPSDGYNVFVMGPAGTGRTSLARGVLEEASCQRPTPQDVCYVYDFSAPNAPRAIALPPGMACQLRDDLDELVEDLRREIASAFESEEYAERRDSVVRQFRETRQKELEQFEEQAQAAGMVVGRGPAGIIVAPAKDGEVLSAQEYAEIPEEERKSLDAKRAELQEKLNEVLRKHHREEKRARAQVKELDTEVAKFAVGHLFEELQTKYGADERVVQHVRQIEADVVQNVEQLRTSEEEPHVPVPFASMQKQDRYELYRANVLLTCSPGQGAPVVYEPNPTIDNLTGTIEHRTQMGALVTDYTMVRAGALHRANGGYLVLEAEAVLRKPYAWEALKRALRNREIRIESLADQIRFLATVSLEPEPIPLDVKVVLVGAPYVYYLLYSYDEDFRKLFKVKADFDTSTKRRASVVKQYARFIAETCRKENLAHFSAAAAAVVAEHAARLAGDQSRLTTRLGDVADLVREAAHWSNANGNCVVEPQDVTKAIEEHTRRSNRVEERLLETVDRGFILLDLKGEATGQVNGLAVVPMGDYWFGRASRVTAKTFAGRGGLTQIDREAKLTGRVHDKGVLILSGFLGDRYAAERPITLSASITFEQTYETIEGDSASSTELYALLSSLSGVPIRQSIAVTGSVNQAGEIQPIGGVNEKIEGFFKACKLSGLTGDQAVVIPRANVQNLMLDPEVIAAVEDGRFHIYAVSTVDQGMEILTGQKMGSRRRDGTFTPGAINAKVQQTLDRFAAAVKGGDAEANHNGRQD